MLRKIGLLMALLLLGYGVIRIGVGGALLAQSQGLIDIAELANATGEVKSFMDVRADKQILPFSLAGYFIYILVMGVALTVGAIGVFRYKRWGFVLIGVYLALHAALFLNFQEINPKLIGLAVQFAMLVSLLYLRPPRKFVSSQVVE